MLPVLFNLPRNADDWNRWSFHHRKSHDVIRYALRKQQNANLADFIIDPIPLKVPKQFLESNQQLHTDFNKTLGTPGSDLEDVDFNDQHALQAWIYLHALEHQVAERTLKVAS